MELNLRIGQEKVVERLLLISRHPDVEIYQLELILKLKIHISLMIP